MAGRVVSLGRRGEERVCGVEMAAMLVTLGYELAGDCTAWSGDGCGDGAVEWKFLDGAGIPGYGLREAIARGLSVRQADGPQRWVALLYHNIRMLLRALKGVKLRPERVDMRGDGWMLVPEFLPGVILRAGDYSFLTDDMCLEGCLASLGFRFGPGPALGAGTRAVGFGMWASEEGGELVGGGVSRLDDVLSRWGDSMWAARRDNMDRVAAMSCGAWNLRVLLGARDRLPGMVRVENGRRRVLVGRGASDGVWAAAERFLTRG